MPAVLRSAAASLTTLALALALAVAVAPARADTAGDAAPVAAASIGDGPLSNKWRLEFSGAAESAGELVLRLTPRGRPPVLVRVPIERNDGENRVARKVKTAIDRQAGRWVDAELDDGEDVLVKRGLFRPRLSIVLVSSTVKAVRIRFDRE